LLRRDPNLRIALVEGEIAGFGASGRNGAWLSSGFPVSPTELANRYGQDAAREQLLAVAGTIDEVATVLSRENIDAHFRRGGVLRVARGPHQRAAVEAAVEAYRNLGLRDRYHLLGPAELARRVRVAKAEGALATPDGSVVHPGRLVRGLARTVERMGAVIYERSHVSPGLVKGGQDHVGGHARVAVNPRPDIAHPQGVR
jgi:glycine/D-amino acid oxidase-like deaminating enzyme